MIYAVEGVDCAGKTTLFNEVRALLRGVTYVPAMPGAKELWEIMPHVELRQERLWWALHDKSCVYVCDRHVVVSSLVYSEVHGRPLLFDVRPWLKSIHVLYVDMPLDTIVSRYRSRGDELIDEDGLARTLEVYEKHLPMFMHTRVTSVSDVLQVVKK